MYKGIYVDSGNTDQAWPHHQRIKDNVITNRQKKTKTYFKPFCRHPIPFAWFLLPKSRFNATKLSLVNCSKYNGSDMVCFDKQAPKLNHDKNILTMWSSGTHFYASCLYSCGCCCYQSFDTRGCFYCPAQLKLIGFNFEFWHFSRLAIPDKVSVFKGECLPEICNRRWHLHATYVLQNPEFFFWEVITTICIIINVI